MKLINRSMLFGLLLVSLLIVGCASDAKKEAEVEEQIAVVSEQSQDAETYGVQDDKGLRSSPLDDPSNPLSRRVIYFDYDSSEVREQDYEILRVHAEYLTTNPHIGMVLEGHADERGSREYNIALGERRARAVERILLLQGPSDNQLQFVSYGEEKPVSLGHGEEFWSQNRRVELIYQQGF